LGCCWDGIDWWYWLISSCCWWWCWSGCWDGGGCSSCDVLVWRVLDVADDDGLLELDGILGDGIGAVAELEEGGICGISSL